MKNTLRNLTEAKPSQNSEELGLQTNAQEQENKYDSGELIERKPINGTPFTAIKLKNTGWFLTIGQHRITEPNYTYEELLEMLENKNWNVIVNTVLTLIDTMAEIRNKD